MCKKDKQIPIPFWFQLIKQWRNKGMGQYGVSFSFLIGAITKQFGGKIDQRYIENAFKKIINSTVQGYYCEVRWCGNIDEPVASIESISTINNRSIQAQFTNKNGETTLAFTSDLMSMFTLNCKNKEDCLDKLILRTLGTAGKNLFSKNKGVFGDFTSSEISFIEYVISISSNT